MNQTDEQMTENNRREYFRNYMRTRYHKDKEVARATKRTQRLKKTNIDISKEESDMFGIYLANVIKIRELLSSIPASMIPHVYNC